MPTDRRLWKQGNCVVISLPWHIIDTLQIKPGDYVRFTQVDRSAFVVTAAPPRPEKITDYLAPEAAPTT